MELLNVLVAGYRVDQDVARTLKQSTGGSDFCFLSRDAASGSTGSVVVASTLDPAASAGFERAPSPAGTAGNVARIEAGGSPYIMLGTPLLDVTGKPIGELRILRSSKNASDRINGLRRNIVIVWIIAVLVGLWLTHGLARRILKPVRELDRGAAEVSQGNYDYRIPVEDPELGTRDELGRLAAAFNAMCASIQGARQELIRQERIATIGRLSTSIVHDLRNPLAAIYGGAEMLIDGELSAGQVQRLAGNIYRSSRRMQELLQELVDAGRGRSSSAEICRLKDIVSAACEMFSAAAESQSVTIETDVPEDLELALERARIERVFLNLIDNALGMMPKGGRLRISARTQGTSVVVRVQDNGPGIPPQIRSRLFQPFVTAGKKNGVGLGLAFSHQTVLDHGGKLWADPNPAEGACFLIQLPFSTAAAD
jgi:signal transduction histidine kinase